MIPEELPGVESKAGADNRATDTQVVSIAAELDSAVKAKGSRHSPSLYDLRALLQDVPSWPFGPDAPQAAELAEWLARKFVSQLLTDKLETIALESIKEATERAWRRIIRDRYALPEFTRRPPWLQLPDHPQHLSRFRNLNEGNRAAYREALIAWEADCERIKAEHEVADVAHLAAKREYHATYDQKLKELAAEIKAAEEAFPARRWEELIRSAFREEGISYYRFENEECGEVPYGPPIVRGFIRPGEPAVIGGPLKSCKTILGIELAAALTTGTPFLGMDVLEAVNVWALTKETPSKLWRERFIKAVHSRRCDPDAAQRRLMIVSDLRTIRDEKKREELSTYLRRSKTRVAILDPLYKLRPACSSADLASEGAALEELAEPFTDAGCCPVFVHHFTKNTPHGAWCTLDDLTGAGVGPFVRAWMLLNRKTEYRGDLQHDLLALIGSGAGDYSQIRVHFDEDKWAFSTSGTAAQSDRKQGVSPTTSFLKPRVDLPARPARPARKG